MHCRATKVLGSRMQHGNAQPTAAHALQGKRNAWVVGCDEDNAQPTAAYAPQRKQNAWTVGCDEDNAQPAAAYALQSNEGLGQSDATRQCAAHSGARTARETKCLGCRMRRRQRAAHSDCKATKFLGSRKQPCNAQPTAAHALQRYEILLIDPWLTHDARYDWSMATPWCYSFVVLVILVKYVICHTVTVCYMLYCYPNKWNQCCC